ncbi:RrF2 family transcriptional regulator [Cohnella faecalis]|uniref:Rrf2 family transcriptional regulator n=1 Tax=Cohnella faecalis TaxID=2315694 RepID=A0A398CGT1_9BACL|nr:Rrf2 family transcriptional regulator [Cohnella faecalis]RIE01953.1 Rrf2 family transcriptional regulator [Cohnella faecalis]RIE01960.1 Rrf2 family transcriptional regulator [Cohnella faecalis]
MNSEFVIAVHSLVLLAHHPEGMASSEEIAANVCTNPARVRKVMSCLRKNGIVDTREGSGGGYKLCKPPERLTLADVYRALAAGSLAPSWCSGNPEGDCVVSSNMGEVMDSVFCGADHQLELYFDGITIGQMLSRVRAKQQV